MTTQERLRKADYCVVPVPLDTCRRLVRLHHYSAGGANTATYRHGLFARGDALHCLGVAWWIPPTRSAAEASWDGEMAALGYAQIGSYAKHKYRMILPQARAPRTLFDALRAPPGAADPQRPSAGRRRAQPGTQDREGAG